MVVQRQYPFFGEQAGKGSHQPSCEVSSCLSVIARIVIHAIGIENPRKYRRPFGNGIFDKLECRGCL